MDGTRLAYIKFPQPFDGTGFLSPFRKHEFEHPHYRNPIQVYVP